MRRAFCPRRHLFWLMLQRLGDLWDGSCHGACALPHHDPYIAMFGACPFCPILTHFLHHVATLAMHLWFVSVRTLSMRIAL